MKEHLKPVFLRWVLIASLIGVGSAFVWISGLIYQINNADFTKISFGIYAVFIIMSVQTGRLTYEAAGRTLRDHLTSEAPTTIYRNVLSVATIRDRNRLASFCSDAFMIAGMIGTVIGFIAMMSGTFGNVSATNIQTVITLALSKMGLALYTTASGLVCGLLLKIQVFNLNQYIERHAGS